MLGINDPWIFLVYILTIFSALLGIIYGIINWNKEAESEANEIKEEEIWEEDKPLTFINQTETPTKPTIKRTQSTKKSTKKPTPKTSKTNTAIRRTK